METICAHCRRETSLQRCSRCRRVWYCSDTCHRNDWSNHKERCIAPPTPSALFALLTEKQSIDLALYSDEELEREVTSHGESLLIVAAQVDNIEVVSVLLKRKIYKNHVDYRGGTALIRAALPPVPGGMLSQQGGSRRTIDLLLKELVDPRPISSFSGKKAHEMIVYPPLIEYFNKFEGLMKNPYFNFHYRRAEFLRTSLFRLAHPAKGEFYRGLPDHPAVDKNKPWYEQLRQLKQCESRYEQYLTIKVEDSGCLYCNRVVDTLCPGCQKARICSTCESSYDPLIVIYRELHDNNCDRGVFG